MIDDTQRSLGRLEGEQTAMQRDIDALRTEVKEVREILQHVASTLDQAKGGWKALLAVGGIAGTVGAGLAHFLSWMRHP